MQGTKYNFFLLLTGQMVSVFGSSVHLVAVIIFIKELTGMAAALGIFQFTAYLPIVILSPLGGMVADSVSKKKILVYTDAARGIIMILLGILLIRGQLNYLILLAGTFLISICSALFHPAAHAIFPEIVPPERIRKKNAVKGTSLLGANIAGSSVGGLAYGLFGPAPVFIINGLSFLASGVEESFIRYRHTPADSGPGRATRNPEIIDPRRIGRAIRESLKELREYLRQEEGVFTILITYGLVNSLYPPVILSLPFLLEQRYSLGPGFFGAAMALLLAGGGAGAFLYGFVHGGRPGRGFLFFSALSALAALLLSAGLIRTPPVLFFILPLSGACIGLVHQIITTSLYQRIQAEKRGRVFGVMESLASFAVPLSYAAGGIILQFMQTRLSWFYLCMAGLIGIVTVFLYFGTRVREFLSKAGTHSADY